ncbi:dihydropteroate synthase [Chitinilyticum aquatile]|uniref:dihydropteroate synthase n=1 Tax=Chitinilyticum aquatile TaxID=362520 RepID=UPI00048FBD5D|nr:dihydropteroate synthase [Chitinilyticum aquatile]
MSVLQCGRFRLTLDRPLVMGIVNVTPDSFSDGGCFADRERAIAHAYALIEQGADILDIGGESTRPGAVQVPEQEEIDRVLPVLEGLHGANVPLSIDTRKPAVMRAALASGVDLVNDIAALEGGGALELLAQYPAAVCLMHKQGEPQTMQSAPQYGNVADEVAGYLLGRYKLCGLHGITHDRILLDPGFGFGKDFGHNRQLFVALPELVKRLPAPLLVGVSRKRMLGDITGRDVAQRMPASITAAVLAAQAGAAVVRVHDVNETVDALKVLAALQSR